MKVFCRCDESLIEIILDNLSGFQLMLEWIETFRDVGMGVNGFCIVDGCESLGARGWTVVG